MPKNYTKEELKNGRWVTVKGHRIFIKDGEDIQDTFDRAMNKQPEKKTAGDYKVEMPEAYMTKEEEKKNKENADRVKNAVEDILKQYPNADADKIWEQIYDYFPQALPDDMSVLVTDNNRGVYDKDAKIGFVGVQVNEKRGGGLEIVLSPSYEYMEDFDDEYLEAFGIDRRK